MFRRRQGRARCDTKSLNHSWCPIYCPWIVRYAIQKLFDIATSVPLLRVQLDKLCLYLVEWRCHGCVYSYLIMLHCFHYLNTCDFLLKEKVLRCRLSFTLMSCIVRSVGWNNNVVYRPVFWYIFADKFLWKRWKLIIYFCFVEIFLLIELVFNWVLFSF